jgi:hypothetical protein
LAWWMWVVPWLELLSGVGGVTGVSIPDCTPSHSNDRCGIRAAVDAYISCTSNCGGTYGQIEDWDTSLVTDMSALFRFKTTFNANIAAWDVSKVTKMDYSKFTLFFFYLLFFSLQCFSFSSSFTFLVGSTILVYSYSVLYGHSV